MAAENVTRGDLPHPGFRPSPSVAKDPKEQTHIRMVRARSVIWALLPVLSLGIATPLVVLFAAIRLKSRALAWAALGWGGAVLLALILLSRHEKTGAANAGATLFLIMVMIGGSFHAFAIRSVVFGLDSLDVDRTARRRAARIIREHPLEAVRLNIGRVDVNESQRLPDGGLIDVNNTVASVLGQVLGLNSAQLAALEEARATSGGFISPADFEIRIGLEPRVLDPVEGRLICLPLMGQAISGPQSVPVQQAALADGRTSGRPLGPSAVRTHLASYGWALLPLVTGGTAAPPAMAFAAARLRSARLWIASAVYLLLILFLAFTEGLSNAPAWNTVALWSLGGIATIQALFLRNEVFEVDVVRSDFQKRKDAMKVAARDPQEAIRLQIGRVDLPEAGRYPDGGLIDMNNIPLDSMTTATGIDLSTSQRIVSTRSALWGFSSLADLCNQLNLSPQMFDAVGDRLVFLPMLVSARTTEATG